MRRVHSMYEKSNTSPVPPSVAEVPLSAAPPGSLGLAASQGFPFHHRVTPEHNVGEVGSSSLLENVPNFQCFGAT